MDKQIIIYEEPDNVIRYEWMLLAHFPDVYYSPYILKNVIKPIHKALTHSIVGTPPKYCSLCYQQITYTRFLHYMYFGKRKPRCRSCDLYPPNAATLCDWHHRRHPNDPRNVIEHKT